MSMVGWRRVRQGVWLGVLAACVMAAGGSRVRGGEPAEVLRVWPDAPPGFQIESGPEADTTPDGGRQVAGRGVVRLGHVSTPTLSVYLPAPEKRNGTSIVVCPGGGWNILAWDLEGTEVAEWAVSQGITAFVLKYRVPTRSFDPRWQAPVQDAQRAVSLVRSQAERWNLEPGRIGVLGFSAGGDTAARTAVYTERQYESLDEADEAPFRPDFAVLVYPGGIVDEETLELKPEFAVTERTPPMFFAHAFDDRIRCENSIELFLALKQAGVPSELHVYATGGHGFGLRPTEHACTDWPARCAAWLTTSGLLDAP